MAKHVMIYSSIPTATTNL